MSQVPVVKFLFKSELKTLTEAIGLKPGVEVKSFNNVNEVLPLFNDISGVLFIAALKDKNDLIQLGGLFKIAKKIAPQTVIKVLAVNFSSDISFEKAIMRLGVTDIVDSKINPKALRFKMDFLLKSVQTLQRSKTPVSSDSNQTKAPDKGSKTESWGQDNLPQWQPPLDCESDIWLLKAQQDCKKILSRWMVKLMGPSPYVGQWTESGTPGVWKFQMKSGQDDFMMGEGFWYYSGSQRPEFLWNENLWLFSGMVFHLFHQHGEQKFSRVCLKDKVLTIARNSDYAKARTQKILASFEKELTFKNEQEAPEDTESIDYFKEGLKDLKGKAETENLDYGQLRGKGKTESLDMGPLDGKSKTDALNGDPLSGKSSTDELGGGPLSGKSKTDAYNSQPLEMEIKPEDKSSGPLSQPKGENFLEGHLKGKNKYQEAESSPDLEGPAADKLKESGLLSMDANNKHQKYYKNHNEAEQFQAKEIGKAIKKDGVAQDLEGKVDPKYGERKKAPPIAGEGNTDHLDGHLRSPQSGLSRPEKAEDDKKSGAFEAKKKAEKVVPLIPSERSGAKSEAGRSASDEAKTGDVLPFEVPTKSSEDGVISDKDLEQATQSAKVSSTLSQDDVKIQCELDDYFDQTIIFSTHDQVSMKQGLVKMNLNFNYMNKDTNIKFEGEIKDIESDGEGGQYITVEVPKENVGAFNSFMKLYQSRQENINLFLKIVKGT